MRFKKYVILEDRCKDCGACLEICPDDAIMRTDRDVCEIDEALCSYCGMCMEVCQVQAVKKAFSISTFFRSLRGSNERSNRIYV